MKIEIISIILCTIFYITICGCISSTDGNDKLPSEHYVAIQENCEISGQLVKGIYNTTTDIIPPPAWYYNHPSKYTIVNSSLKALYGSIILYDKPWKKATNLTVNGIYEYPYVLKSNVTILSIDRNGTIMMTYNNEPITLRIGERWVSPIVSTEVVDETYRNEPYTLVYKTKWFIENKGIYKINSTHS